MTIELNATLLIQAVNFFIAYLILRFLFFKPAVNAVEHEHRAELDMHATIEELNKDLIATKKEQEKLWISCRRFFGEHKPAPIHAQDFIFRSITPPLREQPLSDKECNRLVQEVSKAIVEKTGTLL